jgi:Glu-tRNA(Gln) amidotransferase subunit E-like FAD-binding protein
MTALYVLPDEIRERIARMLRLVATEVRPCKRCGRTVYMLPMAKSGRVNPYTDDGVSHFSDCKFAAEFKR